MGTVCTNSRYAPQATKPRALTSHIGCMSTCMSGLYQRGSYCCLGRYIEHLGLKSPTMSSSWSPVSMSTPELAPTQPPNGRLVFGQLARVTSCFLACVCERITSSSTIPESNAAVLRASDAIAEPHSPLHSLPYELIFLTVKYSSYYNDQFRLNVTCKQLHQLCISILDPYAHL